MKILLAVFGLVACGGSSSKDKPADKPSGPRTQVTYSLDTEMALDDRANVMRSDIAALLEEQKLRATVRVPLTPAGAVTIVPEDPSARQGIDALLKSTYKDEIEMRDCAVQDGPTAMCIKIASSHVDAIKKAALANAVETIRARLDAVKVAHPSVVEKGGMIVVSFPANDEQGARIRDLVARTGKLEFKVVDSDAPFMKQVFAQVGSEGREGEPVDPAAQRAQIRAEVDQWRADDGATHIDYYLVAHDRDQLDRYLRDLAKADPRFVVPDDREIGYELVQPYPDAKDQRPFWRSYFLERTARLTGKAISNATGSYDANTNRPIVLLDFSRRGGEAFGQLTAEIVGKKLATILDGKIKSAPIIMGAIRGGRASITMGGSDPRQQERERDELVTVLKTGSLPAPLREESVTTIGN